jgi:hypothetical protein
MPKKKFTIPYQYTIIGHATVYADTLEEAVEIVETDVPCEEPEDYLNKEWSSDESAIERVRFSYLEYSFEVHDDLDLYNNV